MSVRKQIITGIFLGAAFAAFLAGYSEPSLILAVIAVVMCATETK